MNTVLGDNSNSSVERDVDPVDEIANLLSPQEEDEQREDEVEAGSDEGQETPEEGEAQDSPEEQATWAGVLGVPEDKVVADEDGNLIGLNVKVDGVVSTVGMNDLIAGYQTTQDYTRKTQALSNERKEFEAERTQVLQEYKTRLDDVERLTGLLYQQTVQPFERIDWNALRAENPAEYAAMIQDYNLKQGEFKRMMGAIQQDKKTALEAFNQERAQKQEAAIKANADKLVSMYPEWADKEKASKAFAELAEFSQTYGFSAEEFGEIVDARAIGVLMDAMKFHQGKKILQSSKPKALPKFQSGAKAPTKRITKLEQLTKRAKATSGASKRYAQADAISELLLNG